MADRRTSTVEAILNAVNTPQWKEWEKQGRVKTPSTTSQTSWEVAHPTWTYVSTKLRDLAEEDKNISRYYEIATGKAATPDIIGKYSRFADDPALLQVAISKDATKMPVAGDYSESINSAIKEKMGRDATEAEKTYFGKQMESGNLDLYGLGTFLEGTNEYQTKVADTARTKLAGELGGVDQAYLDKVAKELQARYTAQGRQGAGAFGSALIEAGKDLATQRTGYLAGLGYQDVQRGLGNLRSDYEAQLARQYANQQSGLALGQESRSRYYANQDFLRQQAAQERLMRLQQPKTPSFLQQFLPAAIAGGTQIAAAMAGNPGPAISQYYTSSGQYRGTYPQDNYVMRRG